MPSFPRPAERVRGTPGAEAGLTPAGARAAPAPGFTLLEVLIALVILGVGLTALLSAQSGAIRLRTQAEEITLATFLLEARMADIELSGFPEVGTQEGEFGGSFAGYRWQTTVTDTPFPFVREVRLAVLWPVGPRTERLELVRYMVDRQARPGQGQAQGGQEGSRDGREPSQGRQERSRGGQGEAR